MAHRHSRGQIVVEATLVLLLVATLIVMIGNHIKKTKTVFEKIDLTQEDSRENKKIYPRK